MRALDIAVDRASPVPASAQIEEQLRSLIDAGVVRPGARLPTIRALAEDIGVVPNTVARAYRELEEEGYLIGRGRAGTFATDAPPAPSAGADLDELAAAFLARAHAAGADDRAALAALERARSRFAGGPTSG